MARCSPEMYFLFFVLSQTLMIPLKTFHHTLEFMVDIKHIALDTAL